MATRNLLVRAGFDASGMSSGTRQANNALRQFGQNANRQMSSLSNTVSSSMGKIGKLLAGAFAIGAIVNFGKQCIDLGSNLSEVQNVVDVTFGSMAEDVNEFAKTAITQLGLSETSAKQYTSTMGAMLKSMGLTTKEALTMSKTITSLSADMASFYNLDPEVAFEKIRSGISGETEPLKQLGINMSVANLQAYAMAQGISKAYSKMTQQEQALLRYNYLLSVTADAQGDFARTSDSWANQTRILSEQFNALKAEIGQGLISAFTPVVRALNVVINKLRVAAGYFRSFMELIFGKQSTGGGSGIADVAESTESIADSASGASDAVESVGDAAKSAGKKAKGALASFDELNQLASASDSSDSGSASGLSANLGSMGEVVSPDFGNIDDSVITGKMEEIAALFKDTFSKFETISFEPLVASITRLKEAMKPITETLFTGLKWGIDNVLFPLSQWTIQSLLPAFLNLLSGALTVLSPILKSFQPLALFLWDNFLQPIASWTGGVIVSALEGIASALTKVGNWMSSNIGVVSAITSTLVGFFAAWKVTELLAFIQMSGGVAGAIKAISAALKAGIVAKIADKAQTIALTALYAKDFVVALASSTAALVKQSAQFVASKVAIVATTVAQGALTVATVAWNAICAVATAVTTAFGVAVAFLTSPVGLVIAAIAALVAGIIILIKNWDTVKEVASKCWESITSAVATGVDKIKALFNSVIEFVQNNWQGLLLFIVNPFTGAFKLIYDNCDVFRSFIDSTLQKISALFTALWTGVKASTVEAWSSIKNVWNAVSSWFNTTVIQPIGKAFSTMWNGIKSSASSAFSAIGNSAKQGMNWVIGHINSMINKINSKLSFELPEFFGGGKVGFSIPNIPKLAKGGVIDNPTIAMVGEAGKEAVVPLENNTGWTSEVASLLANALTPFMSGGNSGSNGNSGQPIVLQAEDGTIIARSIAPYMIKEFKRLGFEF